MMNVILTIVTAFVLTLVLGRFLIPALRALKAGQAIREDGPTWHNSKAGTPTMGGLMFMAAAAVCVAIFGFAGMKTGDFSALYVLLLALCFGLVGFLDDFFKVKYKRNLGLTSIQKACLQMAVSAIFLYILYKEGIMSASLYIPFFNVSWQIHPCASVATAIPRPSTASPTPSITASPASASIWTAPVRFTPLIRVSGCRAAAAGPMLTCARLTVSVRTG